MKIFIWVLFQLLFISIGLSQNCNVFQREVDSINKMPLRIAYLTLIDSLGRCVNEEFLDFENMYHYALVGEIDSDMNILATIYFDNQNYKQDKTYQILETDNMVYIHKILRNYENQLTME